MSYERLAYDDQDTTVKMHTDCNAAASAIGVPEQRVEAKVLAAETTVSDRSSTITVSAAAASLAERHLD